MLTVKCRAACSAYTNEISTKTTQHFPFHEFHINVVFIALHSFFHPKLIMQCSGDEIICGWMSLSPEICYLGPFFLTLVDKMIFSCRLSQKICWGLQQHSHSGFNWHLGLQVCGELCWKFLHLAVYNRLIHYSLTSDNHRPWVQFLGYCHTFTKSSVAKRNLI